MDRLYSGLFRTYYALTFLNLAVVLLPSCSPPVQQPAGPSAVYSEAAKYFADGKFDKAIDRRPQTVCILQQSCYVIKHDSRFRKIRNCSYQLFEVVH